MTPSNFTDACETLGLRGRQTNGREHEYCDTCGECVRCEPHHECPCCGACPQRCAWWREHHQDDDHTPESR